MNVGKDNRHPRYICDKCGNEIFYIKQKGFVGINRYCKNTHKDINYKKDFDLCKKCEKKFRQWLKEKELPTAQEIIDKFKIYDEREESKC